MSLTKFLKKGVENFHVKDDHRQMAILHEIFGRYWTIFERSLWFYSNWHQFLGFCFSVSKIKMTQVFSRRMNTITFLVLFSFHHGSTMHWFPWLSQFQIEQRSIYSTHINSSLFHESWNSCFASFAHAHVFKKALLIKILFFATHVIIKNMTSYFQFAISDRFSPFFSLEILTGEWK